MFLLLHGIVEQPWERAANGFVYMQKGPGQLDVSREGAFLQQMFL
jgi:hypothetical protein